MLKACWDCLVGYDLIRDTTRGEEPYSVHLNGNVSRAPQWPTAQLKNEKMFVLPKQLESRDKIVVNCETKDSPDELRIGLVTGSNSPDYGNLACQLEMKFPPNNEDKLLITVVQNGLSTNVYEDSASSYYEDTNFNMEFQIRNEGNIDILIGASYIHTVELMHNIDTIRFLTVNGDVNKVLRLNFQFG